jgi:hypothetical protein
VAIHTVAPAEPGNDAEADVEAEVDVDVESDVEMYVEMYVEKDVKADADVCGPKDRDSSPQGRHLGRLLDNR